MARTNPTMALETAASLTWPPDSRLEIISVVPTDVEVFGGPFAAGVYAQQPDVRERLLDECRRLVDAAAERMRRPGLGVAARVLDGRAASVILEEAERIVRGAGHRGRPRSRDLRAGLPRIRLGRGRRPRALPGPRRPPADGMARPRRHRRLARRRARGVVRRRLRSVRRRRSAGPERDRRARGVVARVHAGRRHDGERRLYVGRGRGRHARPAVAGDAVRRLRSEGMEARSVVREGPAAAEIIAEAESWAADLIVVGTRGHGLLRRLLLGSTARTVLHHAPMSVLIVRPTATFPGR